MEKWVAKLNRSIRSVLVLDVVESVRLAEQDEVAFVENWIRLSSAIRQQLISKHDGRLIKSLGDGLMVDFASAAQAVACGFEMLEAAGSQSTQLATPSSGQLTLRIGVHCGEVFSDEHDLYGRSVNLAARLASLAGPNQMVVSAGIRDAVCDQVHAQVEDMGDCYLKHIAEPVHAFRLRSPHTSLLPVAIPADRVSLKPALAVVPFMPRTGESQEAWLGEVLADEVISAISRSPDLMVISRLSTSPLKHLLTRPEAHTENILTLARERLNVQYVVMGSYQQVGDLIHLHVELVDARRLSVLWAETLRLDLPTVLNVSCEPINALVNSISIKIVKNEMAWARKQALPNLESYSMLMAAIGFMHRASVTDFKYVAQILRALIERHPRLALPRAWLAKWHALCVTRGIAEASQRSTQEALYETGRALDADPECSLALAVEGMIYCQLRKDLDTAHERYERALKANPNDSMAWLYSGVLHSFRNDKGPAKLAGERALSLTPLDPMLYFYQSLAASAILPSGNYARVIELAQSSIRANKRHSSTYRVLAIAQVLNNQVPQAQQSIKQLLELEPQFTVSDFLRRSPCADMEMGQLSAKALREAGLPN
jgi:adenylate cyclase